MSSAEKSARHREKNRRAKQGWADIALSIDPNTLAKKLADGSIEPQHVPGHPAYDPEALGRRILDEWGSSDSRKTMLQVPRDWAPEAVVSVFDRLDRVRRIELQGRERHALRLAMGREVPNPRTDPGQLPLIAQKIKTVGMGNDPTKSVLPLDAAWARELITDREYDAGVSYHHLAEHVQFGPRRQARARDYTMPVIDIGHGIGFSADIEPSAIDAIAECEFIACRKALSAAGSRALQQTNNMILYGEFPGWLCRMINDESPIPQDATDMAALRSGLEAIHVALGDARTNPPQAASSH